jgi:RimJ/RimL family protein N-acetyltransferase
MKLRLATLDDAKDLFDWRNDPITLKHSTTKELIDYKEHLEWLQSSLNNVNRQIFVLEDTCGLPIGTIRCDRSIENQHTLSWTISPIHRKRGYATTMLNLFFNNHHGKEYVAEIYDTNIASINLVRKFKFNLISKNKTSNNQIISTYKKIHKPSDANIINAIEQIRAKNNTHWMDAVRLCFDLDANRAREIFKNIKECDYQVNILLKELADNDDMG